MKRFLLFNLCLAGLISALAGQTSAAEDRRQLENELFTEDGGNTTPAATAAADPILNMTPEPKTVGFSGEITSAAIDAASNSQAADFFYTFTVANVFLDARLPRMAKVFANLEATYLSQNQVTSVALRELFFDFNFGQAIYFRTGKQVLQWGRCYLWNPTDLINVERPHFVRKIGAREGAYGLKAHVPFGAGLNLYSFLDTGNAAETEKVAAALKVEYLLGNMEMALSGWGKKGRRPVWGLDFSTRLFGIDTLGEFSVTQGDPQLHARVQDGRLSLAADGGAWTPRASLNFTRSFTVGDFKDRLTVMVEGYYDRSGYETNVLADPTVYAVAQPAGTGPALTGPVTQKAFIDFYQPVQPNYFSRGYAALFVSFGRFLLPDMTLAANFIRNLVDGSGVLSLGTTYAALNSFTLGVLANGYLGRENTEYVSLGEKYDLQLTFGIAF